MVFSTLKARSQTINKKWCTSPYIPPKNQNPKTSLLVLPIRFATVLRTPVRLNPWTSHNEGGQADAKQDTKGTRSYYK